MTRVADRLLIAGVGLIGASLGMRLRRSGAVGEVVGLGRSAANLRVARREGAIDRAERDLARATRDVDLVVIATPVGTIAPLAAALARTLPADAVLTDAGSVKAPVVAAVERALGNRARLYCGSHPIAGAERAGAAAADVDLLMGHRCILTPTAVTAAATRRRVRALWRAAGMQVEELDAERHDEIYALVSHLPHALATALVNAVLRGPGVGALAYAGTGFRDVTRIAASPTVLWRDILTANREPVLAALRSFGAACERLRAAIADGDEDALTRELAAAQRGRRQLNGRPPRAAASRSARRRPPARSGARP